MTTKWTVVVTGTDARGRKHRSVREIPLSRYGKRVLVEELALRLESMSSEDDQEYRIMRETD